MAKKLEMTFKDASNKTMKITVDNVKNGITDAEVKTAMQIILSKDIFVTDAGSLVAIDDARIVDTTETDLNVE